MNSWVSLPFLRKSTVASALIVLCTTPVGADVRQAPLAVHRQRFVPNPTVPSRRFALRRSPIASGWVIRDLGLPTHVRGGPPSALVPTPYAINGRGDVALAVCPPIGCGNVYQSGTAEEYVYDYHLAREIPLAPVPAPSGAPPAVDQEIPHGLNERGEIVGADIRSVGTGFVSSPVLWRRRGPTASTVALLDSTPGDQGTAFGVNNFGSIVGSVYTGAFQQNSFELGTAVLFTGGTPVPLGGNAGIGGADVYAINDSGVAAGDAFAGEATTFAGGVATAIPPQDECPAPYECDQNLATAINASGVVFGNYVGNYFDRATQTYAGFLWSNGTFETLAPSCFGTDCPIQFQAGDTDYVVAANDNDDFVGYFDGLPWVSFSSVGDANGLLPANSPWKIISVTAINDQRQIVGQGYHAPFGTAIRAFLLEPRGTQ
jgi:hypothetical protein